MPTLSLPNVFTAATTIISSQVNANFAAIQTFINGQIGSSNIAPGGVLEANLADQAVSSAKIKDGTIVGSDIAASTIQEGNIGFAIPGKIIAQTSFNGYSSGSGAKIGINVTGNGVNAIHIMAYCGWMSCTTAAELELYISDNTVGAKAAAAKGTLTAAGKVVSPMPQAILTPFTGTHNFTLYLATTAGTPSCGNDDNLMNFIIAKWA